MDADVDEDTVESTLEMESVFVGSRTEDGIWWVAEWMLEGSGSDVPDKKVSGEGVACLGGGLWNGSKAADLEPGCTCGRCCIMEDVRGDECCRRTLDESGDDVYSL